jgi:uncharacterized protein (DUF427 family)
MKAVFEQTVVAEASDEAIVRVEGQVYFPPDSISSGVLRDSSTPYTCPWKGKATYHDVLVGGTVLEDGAWSYPSLKKSAAIRVGRDFGGYVAFDPRQFRIEN